MSDKFSARPMKNEQHGRSDSNNNDDWDKPKAHVYSCPVCRRAARPGEMICYYCGKFLADSSRPDLIDTNMLTDAAAATFPCPTCQQACSPGDPLCLSCGRLFVDATDTNELEQKLPTDPVVRWPAGEISVDDEQPVILDINGQQVTLPVASAVVLGRVSIALDPEDKRPHTDLSAFDAHEKGVSREHAAILRKHGLVYVVDLGSSNGTILNGTMLAPFSDRVIRSGDELRLARLCIRVIFPSRVAVRKDAQNMAGAS